MISRLIFIINLSPLFVSLVFLFFLHLLLIQGFTPIHEAAQKARTQVTALLLSEGADPNIKNHDGQTALDLATAEDVRCLLMDAQSEPATVMCSTDATITAISSKTNEIVDQQHSMEDENCGKNLSNNGAEPEQIQTQLQQMLESLTVANVNNADVEVPSSLALLLTQRNAENINGDTSNESFNGTCDTLLNTADGSTSTPVNKPNKSSITQYLPTSNLPQISLQSFLKSIGLEFLSETLTREHITLDILAEMGPEELKQIGVTAYGHRHKILKAIENLLITNSGTNFTSNISPPNDANVQIISTNDTLVSLSPSPGMMPMNGPAMAYTYMIQLTSTDKEYRAVEDEMQSSIRQHKDGGTSGGFFSQYKIIKIQKLVNMKLWRKYLHRRTEICDENHGFPNERMLFHGSPFINAIIKKGFDERHAHIGGMFGAGIYFAENSSKSNQYSYGKFFYAKIPLKNPLPFKVEGFT